MKGRYSLSYRDIEDAESSEAKIGGLRGINIDHATLQRWVVKFMPILECKFRKRKFNGTPIKISIDKSGSNKSALNSINEALSKEDEIEIRQNKYLNNRVEGDHRFIKNELDLCLASIIQECRQHHCRH